MAFGWYLGANLVIPCSGGERWPRNVATRIVCCPHFGVAEVLLLTKGSTTSGPRPGPSVAALSAALCPNAQLIAKPLISPHLTIATVLNLHIRTRAVGYDIVHLLRPLLSYYYFPHTALHAKARANLVNDCLQCHYDLNLTN